jgi:hypothetical protein
MTAVHNSKIKIGTFECLAAFLRYVIIQCDVPNIIKIYSGESVLGQNNSVTGW